MDFEQFDPLSHNDFDQPTHTLLVQLADAFGSVEFREIAKSVEWCVRVSTTVAGECVPLAAMGETPFAAAERLVRMCGLRNPDW